MRSRFKTDRRGFAGRWLIGIVVLLMSGFVGVTRAHDREIRWDIVSVVGPNINPGGHASARANDNSRIRLTGRGTFERHGDRGRAGDSGNVTGGGTWQTFSPAGTILTGSGTYRVRRLVRFDVAPGTLPPGANDRIGNAKDARAGLAVLEIRYSDRSRGILVVSCHLDGTPDSVFEGITASKGFVDYWNREAPAAGVDANRTLFHVVEDED